MATLHKGDNDEIIIMKNLEFIIIIIIIIIVNEFQIQRTHTVMNKWFHRVNFIVYPSTIHLTLRSKRPNKSVVLRLGSPCKFTYFSTLKHETEVIIQKSLKYSSKISPVYGFWFRAPEK